MNEDILNTIEVLTVRATAKQEEANKVKKLVNELCSEAGIAPRYADIVDAGSATTTIRSDQFYGQTLTAAIRNYLERRKASNLGAASVAEIYRAIRDGGYKFESKNESNERVSVGNALRKTSSIFHRLPNGEYGLLVWYPSAKQQPESEKPEKSNPNRVKTAKEKPLAIAPTPGKDAVTNQEIRDLILAQTSNFQASQIESAIKAKFVSKELPKTKIPTVLFLLKGKGLIKEVSARSGKNGAVYSKV